jgi:glycine/D-amino acid oxidase-like deaminating enzyme/nitrite reductase/ring-hydroxylating ferredoxin subunit
MSKNEPHKAIWFETVSCPQSEPLTKRFETDVIVIGAGITGITAAVRLQDEGHQVAIIDLNSVGGGTTGHSTGHLDTSLDYSLRGLVRDNGVERARLVLEAKRNAINHIENWDRQFELNSDFVRLPAYHYAQTSYETELLEKEYQAAKQLNLEVDLVDNMPLKLKCVKALCFQQQGRIDPLRYICGLTELFVNRGGQFFEHTRAENIEEKNGRCSVSTNNGIITGQAVVVAGHAPLLGMTSVQPRAYPYQSYVLVARVREPVEDCLYWDMQQPYHYTRIVRSGDNQLLVIGGADHETGTSEAASRSFAVLEDYVKRFYDVESIEGRWSHEFFDSADGLPYIGPVPGMSRVYMGAAYSGDGLTFGTAAGMILSDLVMDRKNKWVDIFSPKRLPKLSTTPRLTKGMLHIARHFIGDRLSSQEVSSVDDIPRGEGRLVSMGYQKLAVYRDENNQVHAMSPVCVHMGCIVQWNAAEKTWDCPCHGGRYDCLGNVIMGPPKHSLEPRSMPSSAV